MSQAAAAPSAQTDESIRTRVDELYQTESRRILATLIRLLGNFDLAEDALHEAFRVALERWPGDGVPANPRAWLISTGRFKALDDLRKRSRYDTSLDDDADRTEISTSLRIDENFDAFDELEDDRLRLIFTCCHPALPPDARVALTLREVCGLTTEAIAHAFLVPAATMAKRIVRAKAKIHETGIPFEVPAKSELAERLEAVLQVVYLVFNEGYAASSGDALMRPDLTGEAVRLGRLLVGLLPEPEACGLLGLMLFHESRRAGRNSSEGDMIALEDQDRSLWNSSQIEEGKVLVQRALSGDHVGAYALQAAIAGLHASAVTVASTNWPRIVAFYDLLLQVAPSPVFELNRAVAVAMHDGPQVGLALVSNLMERGDLGSYYLMHAVRADLYRRLGCVTEARADYERARDLAQSAPVRKFLAGRLTSLVA